MSIKNLGNKIKEAREKSGISQKQLGLMLGLSDKAISAYESCRTLPPIDTLYAISQELKKPVSYFLDEEINSSNLSEKLMSIESLLNDINKEFSEIKSSVKNLNESTEK